MYYSEYSESEEEEEPVNLPTPYTIWKYQYEQLTELAEFFREHDGLEWCKMFYMEEELYNACTAKIVDHDTLTTSLMQLVSSDEWEELAWTDDLFYDDHSLKNLYVLCYHAAEIMDVYLSEHNILCIMCNILAKRKRVYFFEPHLRWCPNSKWLEQKSLNKYVSTK